jgi:hypothetical protein
MASGSKAFMAYVAEGLGDSDLLDWDEATAAFQRKNGSFFDSPATTAAAAIRNGHNDRALQYLDSLVNKLGSSGANTIEFHYASAYQQMEMVNFFSFSSSFCSADCVSAERLLPASHGGHFGKDGDLSELFLRDQPHT